MKIYTKQEIEAVAANRSTALLILPFTYDVFAQELSNHNLGRLVLGS